MWRWEDEGKQGGRETHQAYILKRGYDVTQLRVGVPRFRELIL